MSPIEIVSLIAGLFTLIGGCITCYRWLKLRKKTPPLVQRHTGIPFWDAVILHTDEEEQDIIVARLTVVAESMKEAVHRASQLVEEWNQVNLGFEILTGKKNPSDDEGKPIGIVRSDLLPQSDDSPVVMSAYADKREYTTFMGFLMFWKNS